MNISLRSTCQWHLRGLNLKDICSIFRKFSEFLVKMTINMQQSVENIIHGNRSFCQRVSSPTPLNYRIRGQFYPCTHINYSSFFYHCGAKQTAKYVYPELNAIQLFLFLVLSSTAEPNEKVFWTLGPEVTSI